MIINIIRFAGLLLTALVVGTTFGIWLGYNPTGLSPATYVEQQQHAISSLNTIMPVLGAVCILLVSTLAVLTKGDRPTRYLLVVSVIFLLAAGLITRFGNQPINAIVMTWSAQAPATNWIELRDSWWQWHILRTSAGIVALMLLLLATLRNQNCSH
jgi:uncharacterized membrane protein